MFGGEVETLDVDNNVVVIAGEKYKTVTLNGITVMAENLRAIPEGKSPATADGEAENQTGFWYPYNVVDGVAVSLTDEASIQQYGYLYDFYTVSGIDPTQYADNSALNVAVEEWVAAGSKSSLAPEGWRLPTAAELYQLCGDGIGAFLPVNKSEPFYDLDLGYACVDKAVEVGFNYLPVGSVTNNYKYSTTLVAEQYTSTLGDPRAGNENFVGEKSVSYFMTSTPYSATTVNNWAMMTIYAYSYNMGRIYMLSASKAYGICVRFVKDE
ncbi:MAG: FISUMP domain-containing protein [Rikenellaceae bacterium]